MLKCMQNNILFDFALQPYFFYFALQSGLNQDGSIILLLSSMPTFLTQNFTNTRIAKFRGCTESWVGQPPTQALYVLLIQLDI